MDHLYKNNIKIDDNTPIKSVIKWSRNEVLVHVNDGDVFQIEKGSVEHLSINGRGCYAWKSLDSLGLKAFNAETFMINAENNDKMKDIAASEDHALFLTTAGIILLKHVGYGFKNQCICLYI